CDAFAAVRAGDRDRCEDRGLGDLREACKLCAFERGAALLTGVALGRRKRVDSGVRAHPGNHRRPVRESLPRFACEGVSTSLQLLAAAASPSWLTRPAA